MIAKRAMQQSNRHQVDFTQRFFDPAGADQYLRAPKPAAAFSPAKSKSPLHSRYSQFALAEAANAKKPKAPAEPPRPAEPRAVSLARMAQKTTCREVEALLLQMGDDSEKLKLVQRCKIEDLDLHMADLARHFKGKNMKEHFWKYAQSVM